jgi:hypothetical protein
MTADVDGVYVFGASASWLDDDPGVNLGSSDALLAVFDPELNPVCRVQLGTALKDVGQAVVAVGEHLYVAGYTEGRINGELDEGAACNQDDVPPGDAIRADAFVAKYDKQCQHVWTREFGTQDTDAASAIASDGEHVYVTGFYGSGAEAHGGTTASTHAFVRAYDLEGQVVGEVLFEAIHDIGQAVGVYDDVVHVAGGTDGILGVGASLGQRDVFLASIPRDALVGNVIVVGDGCGP